MIGHSGRMEPMTVRRFVAETVGGDGTVVERRPMRLEGVSVSYTADCAVVRPDASLEEARRAADRLTHEIEESHNRFAQALATSARRTCEARAAGRRMAIIAWWLAAANVVQVAIWLIGGNR